MKFLPILFVVWGVFTAVFLGLLAFNATLSRYEDEQLFLSGNNPGEQQRQSSIARQTSLTRPLARFSGVVSLSLAAVMLGLYTWDSWQRIPR